MDTGREWELKPRTHVWARTEKNESRHDTVCCEEFHLVWTLLKTSLPPCGSLIIPRSPYRKIRYKCRTLNLLHWSWWQKCQQLHLEQEWGPRLKDQNMHFKMLHVDAVHKIKERKSSKQCRIQSTIIVIKLIVSHRNPSWGMLSRTWG